jgi:hypothetical protein
MVDDLRSACQQDLNLLHAVQSIKRAQVHRFRYSYADVLVHRDWGPAAQFFLTELYGERDFSQRDAEFARIAPAIQKLFPASVVHVATALARLHSLTEQLDHAMASTMLSVASSPLSDALTLNLYAKSWGLVGQSTARFNQLALTQNLGNSLSTLTSKPGLRVMLRMMHAPARAAGLGQLQDFLERGYDVFAAMHRSKSGAQGFLNLIAVREQSWMERLFATTVANANSTHVWPELE